MKFRPLVEFDSDLPKPVVPVLLYGVLGLAVGRDSLLVPVVPLPCGILAFVVLDVLGVGGLSA